MVGVIITGHANFPTGILSAVSLVAGAQENVVGVDFDVAAGMGAEELKAKLKETIDELGFDEIAIMCDLAGGTPFKMAAELKMELTDKKIRVMAGTNLPAAIEAAFSSGYCALDELAKAVVTAGKDGVMDLDGFDDDASEEEGEPDFGDEGL